MVKVPRDRTLLIRLVALFVLTAAVVAVALTVEVPDASRLRTQFGHPGPLDGLAFIGLYAAVTLSPLPKAVFSIGAGALFGVAAGLVVVLCGALAGASIAFYLARLLGRVVLQRYSGARLDDFDRLLGRHELWTITGLRLVPVVPFTALNYLSGLTGVRFANYVVGTLVGILPGATAYVTVGAYGSHPGSWPFIASLTALLLLGATAVVIAGTRRQRRVATHGRQASGDAGT